MTQHTTGPWVVQYGRIVEQATGDIVCEPWPGAEWSKATQRANARLIAAAPDGLEANKLSLRNIDSMIYMLPIGRSAERQSLETWAHIVRAAIAKAEGSTTP